ncbi:acyl-CoA dehydrogenase family protein [Pantoea cypripedii]|uniref:SfnB family sulfur acquisition oxidoreductase n=1 Tax=Pantoea cypripedii TaxID=55209 RepID=A0A6B9G4J7_PANCY|nr:acyl-CoA dehydrogenase family protein [Pantoea cypripedii]QGY32601.1 SfnB family sulfur acquisition oxidoreductase [Pantoea cypripedii]
MNANPHANTPYGAGQRTAVLNAEVNSSVEKLMFTLEARACAADQQRDYAEAQRALEHSGLLSLRVPAQAGGVFISQSEAIDITRRVAQADPGVAQLLQPHYGFTDTIELLPVATQAILYRDVLRGVRIASAASERGGKHSADFATTLLRQGDGYVIQGTKYYATGSVGAGWITVIGRNELGGQALAWVRADAQGLKVIDDWNGMGQRGSSSGTVMLDNVVVPADYVVPVWDIGHRALAWHESGRLIHAAIDLGIAEGALGWGLRQVASDTRIPFESPYATLASDPVLQYQIGTLSAQILAAGALLDNTAQLLDRVQTMHPDDYLLLQSQLAAIKALAAEVSLQTSSDVFSWSGARAADRKLRVDRYWRNARTHTLHDPVRLRYQELGQQLLRVFTAEQGAAQ